MHCPECLRIIVDEQAVVPIRWASHVEWRIANIESKDYHADGEQISFKPLVGHTLVMLRGNMADYAFICLISSNSILSKNINALVADLQIVVRIE
mgnify:CR=1 FL=1